MYTLDELERTVSTVCLAPAAWPGAAGPAGSGFTHRLRVTLSGVLEGKCDGLQGPTDMELFEPCTQKEGSQAHQLLVVHSLSQHMTCSFKSRGRAL